jgi:hypothetical protein
VSLPSTQTLPSTRSQRGNGDLILATVRLYCILQIAIFILFPSPVTIFAWLIKMSCHLPEQCFSVRPGIRSEIEGQSLPPCVRTESFSLMSSSSVHLPVRPVVPSMLCFKKSCHLLQHCFDVRPGTSAVMASQSFSPCDSTDSLNLLSSSTIHLPARAVARSMLGYKASCHLSKHCSSVRPGSSAAMVS